MKKSYVRICTGSVLVFMVWSSSGYAKPPDRQGVYVLPQVSPIAPSSPVNQVTPGTPRNVVFKWMRPQDAKVKKFFLWVEDSKGSHIEKTVTAVDAKCPDGNSATCQTEIELLDGSGTWWIQAEGDPEGDRRVLGQFGELAFIDAESQDNVAKCIKRDRDSLTGDFPSIFSFGRNAEWSVGQAISAQMIKYNFATKKAGFNTGIGVGAAFRLFDHVPFDPSGKLKQKLGEQTYENLKLRTDSQTGKILVPVSYIKQDCRAENFSLSSRLAAPIISVTPTIYLTKSDSKEELAVEPAILFGFWRDILNFGVGFNLTGKDGDVGDVFLLFSIGVGFDF